MQHNGRRVGFLYGRHHVETMGHEGASVQAQGDVECPVCAADSHRCVGQYGGHPDLIAWDIIEWWYSDAAIDSFTNPYYQGPCSLVQELELEGY